MGEEVADMVEPWIDLAGKREGDQDAIAGALAVSSPPWWDSLELERINYWWEVGWGEERRVNENPEMSSLSDHMHMEKHADNQEKMVQEGSPYQAPLCPFHTENIFWPRWSSQQ